MLTRPGGQQLRINHRGQVTIPAPLREKYNLREGDEVEVVEIGDTLRIIRSGDALTRGERLVRRMRGAGTGTMTTDEIMKLMRGGDWSGE